MIGSVGGNPFATQIQAYSALKPGIEQQENSNDKLKPASETQESPFAPSTKETSGDLKTGASERSYDSGGITARGNEQRGMLLDVSA